MKHQYISYLQVSKDGFQPGEAYERTKTKYSKKLNVWGAFSSKGVIEFQTFENNMDSQKYIEILEKSKDQLSELHQIDTFCYATTIPNTGLECL